MLFDACKRPAIVWRLLPAIACTNGCGTEATDCSCDRILISPDALGTEISELRMPIEVAVFVIAAVPARTDSERLRESSIELVLREVLLLIRVSQVEMNGAVGDDFS